jgi:hypothetical protein
MREYLSAIHDTFHASPDSMDERFGDICVDLTASPCAAGTFEDVDWPLPNVWLGVSVEDQTRANERIPDLLATAAAIRWLSCEPLLGPVDLTRIKRFPPGTADKEWINAIAGRMWTDQTGLPNPDPRWAYPGMPFSEGYGLNWIVAGGESGRNARPCHPDWARSLRDQCAAAGVPFHFKQWGEWAPHPEGRSEGFGSHGAIWHEERWWRFKRGDRHCDVWSVGKKRAGRLLDGVEHNDLPA